MDDEMEVPYPILLLPKACTNLETNCEVTDNVFIDLNITSPDTEGNSTCIYSGFCNIKLIDSYDVDIQNSKQSEEFQLDLDDGLPVIITDQQSTYNQSQVWIDPSRSPYVYNNYGMSESQETYSMSQRSTSIMVEQHNTYITKYNYSEAIHYSTHEEVETKPAKRSLELQTSEGNYEDDEFECGVFLTQLPKEIITEKQNRDREEIKLIGIESEDSALKQLMSPGIQSMSKQRKTILFLGPDSQCGQTIQQIAYYDPQVGCSGAAPAADVVIEDTEPPRQKRYQCAKCQQIFDLISEFREHTVRHGARCRSAPRAPRAADKPPLAFVCGECGKHLKTKEKFEKHFLGHGDPELECSRCRKVFASKFTLRAHRKIHSRQHACAHCTRTYTSAEEMRAHVAKVHYLFHCDRCDFVAEKHSELTAHQSEHSRTFPPSLSHSDTDSLDTPTRDDDPDWKIEDESTDKDQPVVYEDSSRDHDSPGDAQDNYNKTNQGNYDETNQSNYDETNQSNYDETTQSNYDEIQKADSVIAKVISNKIFLAEKSKKNRRHRKICDVCLKSFDRVSDLKRHLIEHIVRSSLAKAPAGRGGTLALRCDVCRLHTFSRLDRYKAHLRDHAKLTLYKCTFCNKSFSDSSNFSKHKKIHGSTYFQCDLCQRKFNSKKMLLRHMEYHRQQPPLGCPRCPRSFHFPSALNKHVKAAHSRHHAARFRCRFCHQYYKTLKEKWDHEWQVHKVRKMIVDCLLCGAQFRKYSELKRHCADLHNVEIPTAKKLLKKKH